MVERNDQIDFCINAFLQKVRRKYRISRAYIFGSYAKGDSREWSDIDLAIVSPDFSDDLFEEMVYLMRLAASIDDRIEPRPFTKEAFNRNDPLVDEIEKHGIQIV